MVVTTFSTVRRSKGRKTRRKGSKKKNPGKTTNQQSSKYTRSTRNGSSGGSDHSHSGGRASSSGKSSDRNGSTDITSATYTMLQKFVKVQTDLLNIKIKKSSSQGGTRSQCWETSQLNRPFCSISFSRITLVSPKIPLASSPSSSQRNWNGYPVRRFQIKSSTISEILDVIRSTPSIPSSSSSLFYSLDSVPQTTQSYTASPYSWSFHTTTR